MTAQHKSPEHDAGHRDPQATWAKPVDRLAMGEVPAEAINLNVSGKRLSGPLQGFGKLWQKTYRIRFVDANPTPQEVVSVWKREFGTFWPANAHFYAPFTEIAPGEVGLINNDVPGGQVLSTGIMVIYADDVSFTFMTPEGHVFAAWITFSAERDDDETTVAQVQALIRASDPFFEAMLMAGGHGQENRHWETTLSNLAARFGATGTPTTEQLWRRPQAAVAPGGEHPPQLGHPLRPLDDDPPASHVPPRPGMRPLGA